MNYLPDGFFISTDKSKLDFNVVHNYLCNESYWCRGIPKETLIKAIDHSLNFIVLHHDKQIGYARVISDFSTVAYLGDVFILPEYRGKGLSKCLIHEVMNHASLQGLRRWILLTKDAHELYRQFGWTSISIPERWMELHNKDIYANHS